MSPKRLRCFIVSRFKNFPDAEARARRLCRAALEYGLAPFAPHLLYPQLGLDEENPRDRRAGIDCGLAWLQMADLVLVDDKWGGISPGMAQEIRYAERLGIPVFGFEPYMLGREEPPALSLPPKAAPSGYGEGPPVIPPERQEECRRMAERLLVEGLGSPALD